MVGKKVLITAGPTREAIDPVRYITCLLYTSSTKQYSPDEDFLKKASSGEYCFVETNSCGLDMFPDTANIESVVLYKWNRVYPADQYFTMDLSGWKLVETAEFAGSSHEKITEERYER